MVRLQTNNIFGRDISLLGLGCMRLPLKSVSDSDIDVEETEQEAVIRMKNVSAAELDFDTEEITDRFVRGDASRNTEGSGLGLAIARSFTELMNGTLQISTEADLFRVEIRFPKP